MGARLAEGVNSPAESVQIAPGFPFVSAGRNCAQRPVKALSLSVHRGREHGPDLGFSGKELTVEMSIATAETGPIGKNGGVARAGVLDPWKRHDGA